MTARKPQKTPIERGDILTPRKEKALQALLVCRTRAEAAKAAGIGESTLRADLRAALERDVRGENLASPDAVDHSGLELMKSGILSADDFYSLAEKYDDNPTMLRFVAKYAKEAADDMDSTRAKDRGALYQLAQVCGQGQSRTMREWDDLSKIADYCSGQTRNRRDTPTHTISMGKWWEQLSGEIVENF